jgi:hypothetical protein
MNNMKNTLLPLLAIIFTANFTSAQPVVNEKRFAFDIGGAVSELVKTTKEAVGNVFDSSSKEEENTLISGQSFSETAEKKSQNLKDMNTCEVYDATLLNIINLDTASTKASEKVGKIEETIEQEAQLRDAIFEKSRKLTELQKKEKIIFREMRKELEEAKKYYQNIDTVVASTTDLLEKTDCEEVNKKEEETLQDYYQETDELTTEENIFRKTFTASLKEKISILQTGVKSVK